MTDHPVSARPATGEAWAQGRNLLDRILDWLRAGYPGGVPRTDYVALFAVLHRHLTGYEVAAIADELARDNPDAAITRADIESAIARIALEQPDPRDIARVASRLAAGGWPLATPLPDSD